MLLQPGWVHIWQNGHVERLIGSIRRESLDHLIVFGEAHLRGVLKAYASYYNQVKTHLSLDNLPARPPPVASYPVLVHWLVRLLALPSDPVSRRQPLRFAILHLHQVGARTFTSPAIEHARHTGFARCARLLTRTNQKTRRLQSLFQKRRAQAGWAKSEYRCGRPRCIRWNGPFNLATTDKNDCHENRND